ncbi:hypothetical protein [Thiothrix lacustris]|uniref:hypothetical protein n=1 Tax=Thiothrix lacustris TaxID=525917 RepID=UPI0027E52FE2|nr:hypothetical protein [Thiothrix lacustris]WMP19426.1 hypothetical protein RCS87_19830 [Thiothrix lacustris]
MKNNLIKLSIPTFVLAFSLNSLAWAEEPAKAEKPEKEAAAEPAKEAAAPAKSTLPDSGCSLETLAGNYSWDETTITDYSSAGYTKFGAGWVHAVSVGREVNDGKGNITAGQMTINNTFDGEVKTEAYTGVVTVEPGCVGTYRITLASGKSGGGGTIYIDPISHNFTLLDEFNIGTAKFVRDGAGK